MRKFKIQQIKPIIALLLLMVGLSIQGCNQSDKKHADELEISAPELTIHAAAFTGNVKALEQHIKAKTDLNQKDEYGSSPLTIAATFGKTEAAKVLIDAGVDLSIQSADGSTPLHTASFFGRTETVKTLLKHNVDLSVRNSFGVTALEMVAVPFEQVKEVYDQVSRDLGPFGLKLNYDKLSGQRLIIAELLKNHTSK